jgi:fluoride ion exporter CrcB/FEX
MHDRGTPHIRSRQYAQVEGGNVVDYGTQDNPDLDQIISTVATGVSKNISRIGRVNLAEGWDVGTSPQEKSEDLCLGLRDGLCGALSSFSSWISSMVNLFRAGEIGQAIVGLMLGIQLPLIAYRFGQYVSVYIFVWRCRREKRRDERRGGYGIRLQTDEDGSCEESAERSVDSFDTGEDLSNSAPHRTPHGGRTKGRRTVHDEESEIPSVRAIITALFIMCLVAQLTSLNFFYEPDDRLLALSLLFSPLGVLARWRMMKFNAWRPSFPIGTFAW